MLHMPSCSLAMAVLDECRIGAVDKVENRNLMSVCSVFSLLAPFRWPICSRISQYLLLEYLNLTSVR